MVKENANNFNCMFQTGHENIHFKSIGYQFTYTDYHILKIGDKS